jgi:hypothetical protein
MAIPIAMPGGHMMKRYKSQKAISWPISSRLYQQVNVRRRTHESTGVCGDEGIDLAIVELLSRLGSQAHAFPRDHVDELRTSEGFRDCDATRETYSSTGLESDQGGTRHRVRGQSVDRHHHDEKSDGETNGRADGSGSRAGIPFDTRSDGDKIINDESRD